jgi:ArsR family transcriptional regulator, arsenate/arsenite/antimonite-responsive transcriptional repressor
MRTAATVDIPLRPSDEMEGCCLPPGVVRIDPEELARRAKVLAALADPTRMGIIDILSKLEEHLCVCEIVTAFDLGQPTISHHLRILRDAGLVKWEKRGLWVYYTLNREALGDLGSSLIKLALNGK